jgi:hypothetical protein
VVKRGEVGKFDNDCRIDHVLVGCVPELSGKQNQHRPQTLAPSFDEVTNRNLGNRVGVFGGLQKPGLNAF